MAITGQTPSTLTDLDTEDGPVVNVGIYSDEQVTIKFDWSVNQRWYLTIAEARKIAIALLAAAEHQEARP